MKGNTFSKGRPKGSKNVNPYPKSQANLNKWAENPPPSWEGNNHKVSTIKKMRKPKPEGFGEKLSEMMRNQYAEGTREIPMARYGRCATGRFNCKFPEKYLGDPTNIVYRSSWELKVMRRLDHLSSVVNWSSEEVRIPYISPIDGKRHTYHPDFLVHVRNKQGMMETHIWEIKPHAQTIMPKKHTTGKNPTKRYLNEVKTWGTNEAKWNAAVSYCKSRGWLFKILTEKDLFGE